VFYDYDEIEYMTDCNFRNLSQPGSMDDDYAGEVISYVDKRDMFPEQWKPFLTGDPRIKAALLKYHADLFEPGFWQRRKERIAAGHLEDVFPYPPEHRFRRRYASQFESE
jgi:isocitrate dehydrogenase kinase/phosphatase